ncbi:hypothetical protein I550_3918 [Mycobacterium intracellulare 1956]|uniref:Uncharacterized protein n=1 Tax=Mycobacterium intracellulare 1956 TaxID=1299331 RepID=X8CIW4_MYCIT|nr:hypothetical protein L843_3984 [Mycobacterium intracellulare MIN_061107_1834]EUA31650.1 hypothetical protein I548_0417 [Mycobacterium intracellulare]EUA55761.1 hypothetical protein I550_3918 [Mycobacterium intracellulare 1956]
MVEAIQRRLAQHRPGARRDRRTAAGPARLGHRGRRRAGVGAPAGRARVVGCRARWARRSDGMLNDSATLTTVAHTPV